MSLSGRKVRPNDIWTLVTGFAGSLWEDGKPFLESLAPFDPTQKQVVSDHDSQTRIEDSDETGCYVITDSEGTVIYVGLASRAFGYRYWDHWAKARTEYTGDGHVANWPNAKYFYTIKTQPSSGDASRVLSDSRVLLYCAALEAFLIAYIRPELNLRLSGVLVEHRTE